MLTGYRGLVDPAAIGRPMSVLVQATVPHDSQEAFLGVLREHPAVEEVLRVSGPRNYIVRAHLAGTEELEELMDQLGERSDAIEAEMILSIPVREAAIMPPPDVVSRRKRGMRRHRVALRSRRRRRLQKHHEGRKKRQRRGAAVEHYCTPIRTAAHTARRANTRQSISDGTGLSRCSTATFGFPILRKRRDHGRGATRCPGWSLGRVAKTSGMDGSSCG